MNFLKIGKMNLKYKKVRGNKMLKNKVKAIFIDIDGTLRDSNKNLSIRTIETIRKVSKKGILVILCSRKTKKIYSTNQ